MSLELLRDRRIKVAENSSNQELQVQLEQIRHRMRRNSERGWFINMPEDPDKVRQLRTKLFEYRIGLLIGKVRGFGSDNPEVQKMHTRQGLIKDLMTRGTIVVEDYGFERALFFSAADGIRPQYTRLYQEAKVRLIHRSFEESGLDFPSFRHNWHVVREYAKYGVSDTETRWAVLNEMEDRKLI